MSTLALSFTCLAAAAIAPRPDASWLSCAAETALPLAVAFAARLLLLLPEAAADMAAVGTLQEAAEEVEKLEPQHVFAPVYCYFANGQTKGVPKEEHLRHLHYLAMRLQAQLYAVRT